MNYRHPNRRTIVLVVPDQGTHEYLARQTATMAITSTSQFDEVHRVKLIQEALNQLSSLSFKTCVAKILTHPNINIVESISDLGFN